MFTSTQPEFGKSTQPCKLNTKYFISRNSQTQLLCQNIGKQIDEARAIQWIREAEGSEMEISGKKRTFLLGGVQSHSERTARVLGDFGGY